jgi:hypothetical protein
MEKTKKFKIIVSYSVLIGLSVQSFSLFAGGWEASKPSSKLVMQLQKEKKEEVKQNAAATSVMQEFQHCALKTDYLSR